VCPSLIQKITKRGLSMAHPVASSINLSAVQQNVLSSIIRQHHSSQQLVQRVNIIQAAAEGKPNTTIAIDLHTTRLTVRLWRNRWGEVSTRLSQVEIDPKALEQLVREVLKDQPRSGAPPTFTTEQVVHITAIACEDPADSDRPISHWTAREIADEVIKRRIAPTISIRQVGRFLKRGRSQTTQNPILAAPHTG
jgi:putative transposase